MTSSHSASSPAGSSLCRPALRSIRATGDILVALFSGVAQASDGSFIPFVPGDAKVVRVDPRTGRVSDEITGLTTVVDVAVDNVGNIFVVELATDHAELFAGTVDLFDPDAAGAPRRLPEVQWQGHPLSGGWEPPTDLGGRSRFSDQYHCRRRRRSVRLHGAGQLQVDRSRVPMDQPTIVGEVLRITGY